MNPSDPEMIVDAVHGDLYFQQDLPRLWPHWADRIDGWIRSTKDLEGVLRRAEAHAASRRLVRKWAREPAPELVAAFTLARLGREQEAKNWLEIYLANPIIRGHIAVDEDADDVTRNLLTEAMRKIIATSVRGR